MENLDKYIEQLKPLLAKVGEKIGEGAAFGWQIMIRQQYVIAVQDLVGVLAGIAGLLVVRFLYKKVTGPDRWDEMTWLPITILGVGSVGVILGCLTNGLSHLVNPAYYALQDIIQLVK